MSETKEVSLIDRLTDKKNKDKILSLGVVFVVVGMLLGYAASCMGGSGAAVATMNIAKAVVVLGIVVLMYFFFVFVSISKKKEEDDTQEPSVLPENAMYCPFCGKLLEGESRKAKFCPHCGNRKMPNST